MGVFVSSGIPIRIEWFKALGLAVNERKPAVLILHGADGLTMRGPQYRAGAQAIAEIGCHVR